MSAREEVLGSVRAALGETRRPDVPVDRPHRDAATGVSGEVVLALFVDRVEDYRATVTRCPASGLGATVVAALDGAEQVVVPVDLDLDVPGALPDTDLSAAELDAADAVVTRAAIGIAETGTVILDHGPGQGRRAITLLPDLHVCVVREGQVVPGVTEAVAALDPARPQTWISGPSATSDIELSRVEGVHGPRRLHVLLVAE
ncbi:MAG: lactate utilization protein C [Ornithinibacter sp.]